jgi:hypothetical protein
MRPRRSHEELRAVLHQINTQTTPDQGMCRDNSVPTRRSSTTEISRHNRRSEPIRHTCWGVIHRMTDGHRSKVAWRPNRVWSCPACRQWLIARDVKHLLRVIGTTPVVVATIAATAWPTRQRRLQRAGIESATIAQPDGMLLLVAQAQPGEQPTPADQLEGLLTSALERKPEGAKMRPSNGWTMAAARQHDDQVEASTATGSGAGGRPPASKQWRTTHIITTTSMREVVEISKRLGRYVGPLNAQYEEHELLALTSAWVRAVGARRVDHDPSWADEAEAA